MQERTPQRTMEQVVDGSVSHILKESVESARSSPQEYQQQTVEQVVDVLMPHVLTESVGAVRSSAQQHVQCAVEQIVSGLAPQMSEELMELFSDCAGDDDSWQMLDLEAMQVPRAERRKPWFELAGSNDCSVTLPMIFRVSSVRCPIPLGGSLRSHWTLDSCDACRKQRKC